MNLNKLKKELLFIPLGGSGEIGMNLNLYHYDGKWIIVDLGAGFADDYLPGIDMIVPDISFIEKIKPNILGLILTHAHEDHLGAVQYLWNEINCPIYTTSFTANFLKKKLTEVHFSNKVIINEVKPGGKIDLNPFFIDLVSLTHSAPEMQALVIKTDLGNIMHTGDWKFDNDPLVGEKNDEDLLKSYGDSGILAMVGDSTNIFNSGSSGSEGDLRKSLLEIINNCKNTVAVTTFASNIARIETIIKVAEQCGRKTVLAGRSLFRITQAAKETGYLSDVSFLDEKEIKKFPRNKILILCTGCQGEPLAATSKIASKIHPYINLKEDDTIIFSSKIIPGNEKKIYRLFNIFVRQKINLITEKDHFVHVSGHPARDELKKMYDLIRPELAIPVHGELVHMTEHAKFAKKIGVKNAIIVENGDVVKIAPGIPEKISQIDAGYLAIDGNYLISPDSPILKARRKLQKEGVIISTIIINSKGKILSKPLINAPGVLDRIEDSRIYNMIEDEIIKNAIIFQNVRSKSNESVIGSIKSLIRKIIRPNTGKDPIIEINIEKI